VQVYSAAKSIVDAFRFRNRIGEDVAIKALAMGLRSRRVRPRRASRACRESSHTLVIEPYLKALT
jgi:hypothetical protein